ncbi:hypothetical protein [Fodinibius sp. SL11]
MSFRTGRSEERNLCVRGSAHSNNEDLSLAVELTAWVDHSLFANSHSVL